MVNKIETLSDTGLLGGIKAVNNAKEGWHEVQDIWCSNNDYTIPIVVGITQVGAQQVLQNWKIKQIPNCGEELTLNTPILPTGNADQRQIKNTIEVFLAAPA